MRRDMNPACLRRNRDRKGDRTAANLGANLEDEGANE